ncbi:MAG: 23S rRNA (adenine(2503)-C(2))-methyltransferase RlmN [Alphaproteobacteria bacterium]|nr:23S rRNA (adenine(2503)-C(2))-methyltransferase RlmN [Alphaproteobacteria bacterium]MCB9690610.1 23S rRNA (adenine(2503)-C(2))-methyltransferase RlmN [Alphaproteobacteria bacterium]
MDRVDVKCLSRDALTRWMVDELGDDAGRAVRVFKRLWQDGVTDFAQMDGVARATRERLAERAVLPTLEADVVLDSADGTRKFLWKLHDGYRIESVLIPDGHRLTLCMSSQVGCAMACHFCVTGDMGLKRHLTASEIADQALQVQRTLPEGVRITNLVFMGMGEPLHNLKNLIPALEILLDDHGLNFSHRKVTVSTVGLVPKMAELAAALPVNLAISVNATTEEQRLQIMPITRKHSLAELMDAARAFPLPPGKRITFEYVMFAGFNDTLDDAARLFELLRGIPAKVNLIPYNENEHYRDLKCPDAATVKAFQHYFVSRGLGCSVRTTRGLDISAACGQLGRARMGGVLAAQL